MRLKPPLYNEAIQYADPAAQALPARKVSDMKIDIKKGTPLKKLLCLSAFNLLFLEIYIRNNPWDGLWWMITSPVLFLMNVLVILAFTGFIHGLFNNSRVTAVLSLLLTFAYGTVNSLKFKSLGQYYYPWDNRSVTELGGVSKNVMNLDFSGVLLFLAIGVAALILLFRLSSLKPDRMRMKWLPRLGLLLFAVLLIPTVVFRSNLKLDKAFTLLGVKNYGWSQTQNYNMNGAALSYFLSYKLNIVEKPEGYTEQSLKAIEQQVRADFEKADYPHRKWNSKKPNIIVVMNESLWDPNTLSELKYSQNPVKNLEADKVSNFISPTFGGYTCNVEFEFLTSMNTQFLPSGSAPYQQYVKSDLPSLPREFENNGYKSYAIHPYYGWFWGRNQIYKYLGFNEFTDITGFDEKKKKGFYVADSELADKVAERVKNTEEPVFIFAVTMQNHGPYNDNRYKQTELDIEGLDPSLDNRIIKTYTQGTLDADRAYKKLTEFVDSCGEPTLVVTFGDHLPVLGDNYEMYKKYGYVADVPSYYNMKYQDQLKLHITMMAAHSNYKALKLPEYVSPSMLSAYLLSYVNADMSDYYKMVYRNSKEYACVFGNNYVGSGGEPVPVRKETMSTLKKVQYDLLIGKQYFWDKGYVADREQDPLTQSDASAVGEPTP